MGQYQIKADSKKNSFRISADKKTYDKIAAFLLKEKQFVKDHYNFLEIDHRSLKALIEEEKRESAEEKEFVHGELPFVDPYGDNKERVLEKEIQKLAVDKLKTFLSEAPQQDNFLSEKLKNLTQKTPKAYELLVKGLKESLNALPGKKQNVFKGLRTVLAEFKQGNYPVVDEYLPTENFEDFLEDCEEEVEEFEKLLIQELAKQSVNFRIWRKGDTYFSEVEGNIYSGNDLQKFISFLRGEYLIESTKPIISLSTNPLEAFGVTDVVQDALSSSKSLVRRHDKKRYDTLVNNLDLLKIIIDGADDTANALNNTGLPQQTVALVQGLLIFPLFLKGVHMGFEGLGEEAEKTRKEFFAANEQRREALVKLEEFREELCRVCKIDFEEYESREDFMKRLRSALLAADSDEMRGKIVNLAAQYKGRVDLVFEDRGGGALGNNYESIKGSLSGNPFDFRRLKKGSQYADGWNNPDGSGFTTYDGGAGGMSEIIATDRVQIIDTATKQTDLGKVKLAGGFAHHKQNSFYEGTVYNAKQDQGYAHMSDKFDLGKNLITVGTDYRYQDLTSMGHNADGVVNNGIDNYRYEVNGFFAQLYRTFLEEKLETNFSARFDHHNVFGNIFVPRANALYHHNNSLSSRLSAGLGYRAPTSFFEQEHGILDTTSIVREINEPEKSQNVSYSLNYAGDRFESTLSYNYNNIENFAMLDSSYNNGTQTLFTSASSPVIIQGVDLNTSYKITPSVSASVGGERFFYRFQPGTLLFSRPEEKLYFGIDYDKEGLDLFAKVNWTGSQNLAKFYNYENEMRYNLDGSEKIRKSPSFFTLDLGASYEVTKTLQIFGGIENFFNYLQSKKDSQLWINSAGEIDVTQIWGPQRGRHIFVGVKMSY